MKYFLLLACLFLMNCSSSKKKEVIREDYPDMNAQNVRYIIESNINNFKSCYDRHGQNARQFITMSFLVDEKGNVRAPIVESNTNLQDLEECLETILLNLSFEKSRKNEFRRKAKQTLTFVSAFEPESN